MTFVHDAAGAVLSPFRAVGRTVLRRVNRLGISNAVTNRQYRPKSKFTLPLIEQGQLSSLYYAIQQATLDDKGYEDPSKVSDTWLQCVVAGQYFSDRLLVDMTLIQSHMSFWKARLRQGNNRLFLTVSQGPITFARTIVRLVRKICRMDPGSDVLPSHRIEQRIVTLRTMLHALTAVLARVHEASARLKVAPEFQSQAENGRGMPVEIEEGSTARAVAAAAEVFSQELAAAADSLLELQERLDAQHEGSIQVNVSSQPVLFAAFSVRTETLPVAPLLATVEDVPGALTQAQARLRTFLGVLAASELRMCWVGKPVAGMQYATAAADRDQRGLMVIPPFARSPSRLQRYWVQYTINLVVVTMVSRFLYCNSRLSGSGNLERWISGAYVATLRGARDNVVRPLNKVRGEFFETFSSRASYSKFSRADFEASKASLQRMLNEFAADVARHDPKFKPGAEVSGMEVLMRHYERELRHPLRNAVTGYLPRSLLIQVHKMKTDTEAAMMELDQIMRANELTMAVTAALPAMLVAGAVGWGVYRFLSPSPPDVRTMAAPVRVGMAELERAIDAVLVAEESGAREGGEQNKQALQELLHLRGLVLFRLASLRATAGAVHRISSRSLIGAGDSTTWARDWQQLESDLLDMSSAYSAAKQARVAERMQRTYLVFRS